MMAQFETLLKHNKKSYKNKNQRLVDGIQLKKPVIDDSYHSSVMQSQRNSSIRNVVNTTYFNSEQSFSRNSSRHSLSSSRPLPNIAPSPQRNSSKKLIAHRLSQNLYTSKSISTQKQSPQKTQQLEESKQVNVQNILKKYIDTNFIQTLISFMNKQWEIQQQILLKEKRFEALKNLIVQKTNQANALVDDFIAMEYEKYSQAQSKIIMSLMFKIQSSVLKEYEGILSQLLKKVPEDKIVKQQTELQQLQSKLIQIFDVKYISSNQKMKERAQLFLEKYTIQKNNLAASVIIKLKPQFDFLNEMERYLMVYQKQLMRARNQLQASELEKAKVNALLKKKVNFAPIQMDYDKFKEIKDESKRQFFEDLQSNYVNFHQQQHQKNDKTIKSQATQNQQLKLQLQQEKQAVRKLKNQIQNMKNSVPKKQQAAVQVHFYNQQKSIQSSSVTSTTLATFLQNVSTPFTFSQKITGALISIISIDKILQDYEIIRHKTQLQSFSQFLMSWFLVRTGNKKVAQIFTKNFMYSIKDLKNKHKRFNIFSKICGFNGFRKKSVQEDLQYIFFQTHKAWHYLIKIAMFYRKKLNDNPTGYQLFPPLQCEGIFKIPLRKVYELIQEFLTAQGFTVPTNINNLVDYYAINEISKFKLHDEQFQKEQMQEIHILREINFDIIAGFVIEYIAKEKCSTVDKLLRAITIKQKQTKNVLGYSEFETVYRKFYKERRAKIENIYTRMCVVNQYDMMDIENAESIIRAIIEDESGMRTIFEDVQSLKSLMMSEKTNLRGDKLQLNANSYENFRQRFYYEFYDFYDTTFFLEETFRVIKSLIKKKLKSYIKNQEQLQSLMAEKQPIKFEEQSKPQKDKEKKENDDDEESEDQYSEEEPVKKTPEETIKNVEQSKKKNQLQSKVEEWGKIVIRIPHFSHKILTIEQTLVHNMRRKQMIEASQFAWRTLRDILILISKQ